MKISQFLPLTPQKINYKMHDFRISWSVTPVEMTLSMVLNATPRNASLPGPSWCANPAVGSKGAQMSSLKTKNSRWKSRLTRRVFLTWSGMIPFGPSAALGELSNIRSRYKDQSPTLGRKIRAAMSNPATCSSLFSFRFMSPGGRVWSSGGGNRRRRSVPGEDNFHSDGEHRLLSRVEEKNTRRHATSAHYFQSKSVYIHLTGAFWTQKITKKINKNYSCSLWRGSLLKLIVLFKYHVTLDS